MFCDRRHGMSIRRFVRKTLIFVVQFLIAAAKVRIIFRTAKFFYKKLVFRG